MSYYLPNGGRDALLSTAWKGKKDGRLKAPKLGDHLFAGSLPVRLKACYFARLEISYVDV